MTDYFENAEDLDFEPNPSMIEAFVSNRIWFQFISSVSARKNRFTNELVNEDDEAKKVQLQMRIRELNFIIDWADDLESKRKQNITGEGE